MFSNELCDVRGSISYSTCRTLTFEYWPFGLQQGGGGGQTSNAIPPSSRQQHACVWPSSRVEAGKTEYLCVLFHTGRAAGDGAPLCGISRPSPWIVPFTGEKGRDERRRTHSSFKFYGRGCLQPQFSWHVTKRNMHTAAELTFSSWSLSLTHKLLSLPQFQPQMCLVLAVIRSLPASISSRLQSAAIAFLLCIFFLQQYCLFARGGADWRCLAASRPGPARVSCMSTSVRLQWRPIGIICLGLCLFWTDNGLLLRNRLIDTLALQTENSCSSGQTALWLFYRAWTAWATTPSHKQPWPLMVIFSACFSH